MGLDVQPDMEAPSPVKDQAAPPMRVDSAELARPQALSEEAEQLPSLAPQQEEREQPAPSIAKDVTAKSAREKNKDVTRPARTKSAEQVPTTVTRKPKLAPKSPIPDNPY